MNEKGDSRSAGRWLLAPAAVLIGVVLGYMSEHVDAVHERRATLDRLMALALILVGTFKCRKIVRTWPDNRLLLAGVWLFVPLSPVLSKYLALLDGTLAKLVIGSTFMIWLMLLVACLKLNRRLALGCVRLAGAVATSGVLLRWRPV
jgi:hypothetical protein